MSSGEVAAPKHLASCSDFPPGYPKRSPVNPCPSCWLCSPPTTSVLLLHLESKITASRPNPLVLCWVLLIFMGFLLETWKCQGQKENILYFLLVQICTWWDPVSAGAWGLITAMIQKERKMRWKHIEQNLLESSQKKSKVVFLLYFNLISSPQSIGVGKPVFI